MLIINFLRIPGGNINSEEDDSKLDSDEEPERSRFDFGEVFIGIETAPGYGIVTEEKIINPQESKRQLTKVIFYILQSKAICSNKTFV